MLQCLVVCFYVFEFRIRPCLSPECHSGSSGSNTMQTQETVPYCGIPLSLKSLSEFIFSVKENIWWNSTHRKVCHNVVISKVSLVAVDQPGEV